MKKILALILASFLLFSFAACTQGNKTPSDETLVSLVDSENVSVKSEKDVFPKDTVVTVKEINSGKSFDTVNTALKTTAKKFTVYDITATNENVSVQPNGTVKATFNIPENYDIDSVAVVYISDDGKVETLSSVVDKESKTVTAELLHFSFYAVIEKVVEIVNNESQFASSENSASEIPSKPLESSKPTAEPQNPVDSQKPVVSQKPSVSSKPKECAHKYSAATCTTPKTCTLCKKVEGSALGHDYIDDKCSRCKAVDATYKALTSGHWTVDAVANNKLYAFSFVFSGEEPFASVGVGDNFKTLPEDFQEEILGNPADYADSIYTVGNEKYYIGMGGGCPISFTVNKNTVVITEAESTNTITLERASGTTYTITALNGDFNGISGALKKGMVLTWQEAVIAED